MLLNTLADSLSTWRGKLAISRLVLDAITTLKRLDKEIDLQAAESFATLGLVLEKISLISITPKAQPEPWLSATSVDEIKIPIELPFPLKLEEEEEKPAKLILKCIVCVERNEKEEISSEVQTELGRQFTECLLRALTSEKVPRAVTAIKKFVDNIHSRLDNEKAGSKWEARIEDVIEDIGPTGMVLNAVRIIFAYLDAYKDVRKKFLAVSADTLHSKPLTIKYFSLIDADVLDENGKSLFANSN
ncbi:hypothetical protein BH11CYA1_BH11CYA1_00480 [soil metagenome]